MRKILLFISIIVLLVSCDMNGKRSGEVEKEAASLTDLTSYSLDKTIKLAWTNPGDDYDSILLDVKCDDLDILEVALPSDTTEYEFSSGEHGKLYEFSLSLSPSGGGLDSRVKL